RCSTSGLLQPLPVPHRPWSDISLDFVTGLPSSKGATVGLTSGYHPQSNGQVERMNQELETGLRCLVSQNPASWSKHLMWVEYAHNTLPSSATGLLPLQCADGYTP